VGNEEAMMTKKVRDRKAIGPEPEYLTVPEAARLARLHFRTLYRMIERGELGPAQGLIRRAHRQYLIKAAPFRRVFIEGQSAEG
jgi:excisionase family DNA binding protein